MDTEQICADLERVRHDYRQLVDSATVAELRKPTSGTKWTNEQLLFHMLFGYLLFGYLLVRNLRFLVKGFSRLPDGASRRFAALLNAGTGLFHVINYVGSLFGARAWDIRGWSGSWTACWMASRGHCGPSRRAR